MQKLTRTLLASLFLFAAPAAVAQASEPPSVVASIKPVHSLVAGVMQGVGTPGLIVDGAASPHDYALKPSQAEALQQANLVFWIGENLETFLEKPLESIASDSTAVELSGADGMTFHAFREIEELDGKGHDHGHKKGHSHGHGHGHGHEHASDDDPHVWLDPQNAIAMVSAIEAALVKADAANVGAYQANAEALRGRLAELDSELAASMKDLSGRPFVVFHDAYQYFERRYGLEASGAISMRPETAPGAAHVAKISKRIKKMGVVCVFAEPQFEPRLISVVTEGAEARTATLDPLGASLENGPDQYFQLMRDMAASFRQCLAGTS